ncbi:MAG: hypothetical protein ABR526_04955 [Chthoniobacterales bacterium]
MGTRNSNLDRLLRSAAQSDEPVREAPFGFDTRVLAALRVARGESSSVLQEFASTLRRIAAVAAIVTAVAGIGAYWQLGENEDESESLTNAYAIADTAIDSDLLQ